MAESPYRTGTGGAVCRLQDCVTGSLSPDVPFSQGLYIFLIPPQLPNATLSGV